jgi:hypothetical protein
VPSPFPDPPHLPTLDALPSWCNNAARVDRSACVEIRAAELWRFAELMPVRFSPVPTRTGEAPGERETRLEAVGEITITGRFLFNLHRTRLPRRLKGDWRTDRANAMKREPRERCEPASVTPLNVREEEGPFAHTNEADAPLPPDVERAHRARLASSDSEDPFLLFARSQSNSPNALHGLSKVEFNAYLDAAPNPNAGATRTKKLGLYAAGDNAGLAEEWRQTIRIERWRLHERLAYHYLTCPFGSNLPSRAGRRAGREGSSTSSSLRDSVSPSLPSSTSSLRLSISSSLRPPCLRRVTKLFLPLCTEAELLDAELAEGWIKLLDATAAASRIPLPRELLAHRAKLIDRYGLLFGGSTRPLRCRNCLKLRYGACWRMRKGPNKRSKKTNKTKRPEPT